MSRKTATYLALLASLHFTVGCARNHVQGPWAGVAQLPPVLVEAKALPEVRIEAGENPGFAGKITGLETSRFASCPPPWRSTGPSGDRHRRERPGPPLRPVRYRLRKRGFAAVLLSTVFLLQNCATILKGTTPLTLKLGKERPHVIRIEQAGQG